MCIELVRLTEERRVVDIHIEYQGQLHCKAAHGPSATELQTDAPVDNKGRGETFSPTDLVATALGTCMATMMGIEAEKQGYRLDGMRVHVKKHMTATPPRRIDELEVKLRIPASSAQSVDPEGRERLRYIAETCPVRLSLLDAIRVPLRIEWE
jgi:putative redox protein